MSQESETLSGLKIPEAVKNDIRLAVDSLLERFPCEIYKIVLFGSYATGRYQTNSDIDLAIALNELPDPKLSRLYKQAVDMEWEVDLIFCSREQLESGVYVFRRIEAPEVLLYEQL